MTTTTLRLPTTPATRTIPDPYIAYALKLSGGLDAVQSHKAAKRADPANRPCEHCRMSIYGCVDCNWLGVVPVNQPTVHRHRWAPALRLSMHISTQVCLDCGEITEVDSSD